MTRWFAGLMVSIAAVFVVTQAIAQTSGDRWGDGGVSPFYTWTDSLPAKPGELLRAEPLLDKGKLALPNAATGQRILYTSTDGVSGTGIVTVSGAYYTPKGTPPPGGWPLIAWAHGTVGVADVCAPSWQGRSKRDVAYLGAWLANGFAVVATDYQGLGVPGPHPYVETRPEAYSVLDSIRAVQGAEPNLSRKVVVVGQSQGGGAAFATAALAVRYAEIDLRATVATGTPNLSLATLASASNTDLDRVDPTIAYVYYLALAAQETDPGLDASAIFTAKALPLLDLARTRCEGHLSRAVIAAQLTRREALKPQGMKAFAPLGPTLGYATLKLEGPVFMGIGSEDKDVNPAAQLKLARDACKARSLVEAHLYAGLNHGAVVNASFGESLPFVRKALAGKSIAPRCTPRPEPPPATE